MLASIMGSMAGLAYNQLRKANNRGKKSSEKLSSMLQINRAGDDAAGLAISEKMKAETTMLRTAQKNVKDGISLVQTAEGALQEIHEMLNRLVELSDESANGTYTSMDRETLQREVEELKMEIDRIADSTNFNGILLLDGSLDEEMPNSQAEIISQLTAKAGIGASDKDAASASQAGRAAIAARTMTTDNDVFHCVENTKGQNKESTPAELKATVDFSTVCDGSVITVNGVKFEFDTEGSLSGTGTQRIDISGKDEEAIKTAFVEAVNQNAAIRTSMGLKDTDGNFCTASGNTLTFKQPAADPTDKEDMAKKDGKSFSISASLSSAPPSAQITGAKGDDNDYNIVIPTGSIQDGMKLKLYTGPDSKEWKIRVVESADKIITGADSQFLYVSKDKMYDKYAKGGLAYALKYALNKGATVVSDPDYQYNFKFQGSGGNLIINIKPKRGTPRPPSVTNVEPSPAEAPHVTAQDPTVSSFKEKIVPSASFELNVKELKNGDYISFADPKSNTKRKIYFYSGTQPTPPTVAADDILINLQGTGGHEVGSDEAVAEVISEIEAKVGSVFSLGSVCKLSVKAGGKPSFLTFELTVDDTATGVDLGVDLAGSVVTSGIVRESSEPDPSNPGGPKTGKSLRLQIGDGLSGNLYVSIEDMSTSGLKINMINIDTQAGANDAINVLKDAINKVSSNRGTLGALTNRLEHTYNNLGVTLENTTDAENKISGTDAAKEMMRHTKNQIIQQAAQSMLAQSMNLERQSVQQLLSF